MQDNTIHILAARELDQVSGGFFGGCRPGLWPPVAPFPACFQLSCRFPPLFPRAPGPARCPIRSGPARRCWFSLPELEECSMKVSNPAHRNADVAR